MEDSKIRDYSPSHGKNDSNEDYQTIFNTGGFFDYIKERLLSVNSGSNGYSTK